MLVDGDDGIVGRLGNRAEALFARAQFPVFLRQLLLCLENALRDLEPGTELFLVYGFGEKVVNTSLQSLKPVLSARLAGQHQDVGVCTVWNRSDATTELEAVYPWHHPIGQNDGEGLILRNLPGLEAVSCHHDAVAEMAEDLLDQKNECRVVVSNQNSHAAPFNLVFLGFSSLLKNRPYLKST